MITFIITILAIALLGVISDILTLATDISPIKKLYILDQYSVQAKIGFKLAQITFC